MLTQRVSMVLFTSLFFVLVSCQNVGASLLVRNKFPIEQIEDNPFWDEIKKEIATWLPVFVIDFPYPDMTNNISGVQVDTYHTKCQTFEVDQKNMDIQLEPGFPDFKGVITTTVSQAVFSTGLNWKKDNCIWILPCLDTNDTLEVGLTNFTLLMHVTMDVNPFDHDMTPKVSSANATLDQVDIQVEGHWYDQWLYDLVMKVQGAQIDEMAKQAIEKVIEQKLNTLDHHTHAVNNIQLSPQLDEMVQELQEQLVVEE